MSCVIVSLYGGLGNQLFQYATGRSLSILNKSELIFDLGWFDESEQLSETTPRKYTLSNVGLHFKCQSVGLPHFYHKLRFWRVVSRFLSKIGLLKNRVPLYNEAGTRFDKNLLSLNSPIWLNGYWQSYKYFESISDVIKSDLQQKKLSSDTGKLLKEIEGKNAICIHFRRGDYITNKNAATTHGTCKVDYYYEGLNIVKKNFANPECYIFSDDPAWVRLNFKPSVPMTVVDINGPDEAYQDLFLMAACKRFIIANSSLSWWGAWLSSSENKVVVAPKKWFANKSYDTSDLIPPDWIRI